jgi:hypothetical protein
LFSDLQITQINAGGKMKEGFMKKLIQLENSRALIIAVAALISLTLLPNTRAIVPAPDGGYPGGNTAEGQAALLSLTTGGFNTAVGYLSLRSNITNSFNTATGAGTLLANTADENTATGAGALLSNTIGNANTANGALAPFFQHQRLRQHGQRSGCALWHHDRQLQHGAGRERWRQSNHD